MKERIAVPITLDLDAGMLGPEMLRLTGRQRRFVRLILEYPTAPLWKIMRHAGYGTETSSNASLRVMGCSLVHNERILAAMREETSRAIPRGAMVGIAGLIEIATDKRSPDRLKACIALADRGGFGPKTEHKVIVERTDEGRMLEFAERLANELGIRREKLVGPNVIDGKATKPH